MRHADGDLAAGVRLLRSHALSISIWDRHLGHDPAYDWTVAVASLDVADWSAT